MYNIDWTKCHVWENSRLAYMLPQSLGWHIKKKKKNYHPFVTPNNMLENLQAAIRMLFLYI